MAGYLVVACVSQNMQCVSDRSLRSYVEGDGME